MISQRIMDRFKGFYNEEAACSESESQESGEESSSSMDGFIVEDDFMANYNEQQEKTRGRMCGDCLETDRQVQERQSREQYERDLPDWKRWRRERERRQMWQKGPWAHHNMWMFGGEEGGYAHKKDWKDQEEEWREATKQHEGYPIICVARTESKVLTREDLVSDENDKEK